MRLLRRKMAKIEKEHELARAASANRPVALVWTSDNQTVGEIELAPDQHIARDVIVIARREHKAGQLPSEYRIVERVTEVEGDYGRVEDDGGRIIGKVHASEPPYLDIEWFEGELSQ